MIEIKNISKTFSKTKALDDINLEIKDGTIVGLVGTNGAGKSTLLRLIAGILKPNQGEILIDGTPVWNKVDAKSKLFYISDDQYFLQGLNAKQMGAYYKTFYPEFDTAHFEELLDRFDFPSKEKIQALSKGTKKQLSILIGVCTNTAYLLCDEAFDGLDPLARQAVKSLFVEEMEKRSFTPIIASHNLRELEDIVDHIHILHKGATILSENMFDLKENLTKIQCILPEEYDEMINSSLLVLKMKRHGKLLTMIVRGESEKVSSWLQGLNPIYCETTPLSLEEIFICETEVIGYEIKNILF